METDEVYADQTSAVVRALVAGVAAVPDIGEDDDLLGGGLLDSMGVFSLVAELEGAFGLRIHAACLTVENFRSIHTLADMVRRLRSGGKPV